MRTGASLALIGFGAILAFAVTARTSFLNVQVAGFVCMAVGLIGIYLRHRSWAARQLVVRRTRAVPRSTTMIQHGPLYAEDQASSDGPARAGLSGPPAATSSESAIVEEEYYEDQPPLH